MLIFIHSHTEITKILDVPENSRRIYIPRIFPEILDNVVWNVHKNVHKKDVHKKDEIFHHEPSYSSWETGVGTKLPHQYFSSSKHNSGIRVEEVDPLE